MDFLKCFFLKLQMAGGKGKEPFGSISPKCAKKKFYVWGHQKISSPTVFFFSESRESDISFSSASNCIIFRSLLWFKL